MHCCPWLVQGCTRRCQAQLPRVALLLLPPAPQRAHCRPHLQPQVGLPPQPGPQQQQVVSQQASPQTAPIATGQAVQRGEAQRCCRSIPPGSEHAQA